MQTLNTSRRLASNGMKQRRKPKIRTLAPASKEVTTLTQQQSPKFACHCCGDARHRLCHCPLKDVVPKEKRCQKTKIEWHKSPPTKSFIQEATIAAVVDNKSSKLDAMQEAMIKEMFTDEQLELA